MEGGRLEEVAKEAPHLVINSKHAVELVSNNNLLF